MPSLSLTEFHNLRCSLSNDICFISIFRNCSMNTFGKKIINVLYWICVYSVILRIYRVVFNLTHSQRSITCMFRHQMYYRCCRAVITPLFPRLNRKLTSGKCSYWPKWERIVDVARTFFSVYIICFYGRHAWPSRRS